MPEVSRITSVSQEAPSQQEITLSNAETKKEDPHPISLHEGITGRPYLVDHLKIADIADALGLTKKAKDISDYVTAEIKKRGWTDTEDSFSMALGEIIPLDPNLKPDVKIDKLYTMVKILIRQNELEEKKKWLLGKTQ